MKHDPLDDVPHVRTLWATDNTAAAGTAACAHLEVVGAGHFELGHFGGGGNVSDGLDGGDDERQEARNDQRRVHRQGEGEHPKEGDAVG